MSRIGQFKGGLGGSRMVGRQFAGGLAALWGGLKGGSRLVWELNRPTKA